MRARAIAALFRSRERAALRWVDNRRARGLAVAIPEALKDRHVFGPDVILLLDAAVEIEPRVVNVGLQIAVDLEEDLVAGTGHHGLVEGGVRGVEAAVLPVVLAEAGGAHRGEGLFERLQRFRDATRGADEGGAALQHDAEMHHVVKPRIVVDGRCRIADVGLERDQPFREEAGEGFTDRARADAQFGDELIDVDASARRDRLVEDLLLQRFIGLICQSIAADHPWPRRCCQVSSCEPAIPPNAIGDRGSCIMHFSTFAIDVRIHAAPIHWLLQRSLSILTP